MMTTEKKTGSFTTQDGAELYYEIRQPSSKVGDPAEPVIFVYGIACLLNHFHHQIDYFANQRPVYAYDLRGHEKSSAGQRENLTVRGLAHDLRSLMDHWGLEKAHLVGHSFGVPILLAVYDEIPDRISSLTFINGFAQNPIKGMFGLDVVEPFFYWAKDNYYKNTVIWKFLWKAAIDNPVSIFASGLAGGFNLRVTQLKDIEVYARGVSHMSLDNFIPLFEDMMGFDGRGIASRIEVPTLIITGEKDFVTPQKFQEDLHTAVRGSELVRIPYGSHCCQLDFPDYVNLRLEKHLLGLRGETDKGRLFETQD